MTGDAILERGAERLQELSDRAAASGGPAAKLAEPLAEDAVLLRRMKPSLIAARLRGDAPTDLEPGSGAVVAPPAPKARRNGKGGGPNPILVIGGALLVGIVLAKVLDWRGHAHPRD
ncbi:MAG TPA: hypothetical protein VFG61_03590 [Gaiellaceae bacterium]|nr:hypothetical protein [Gaiellaceae bacterium]